jgi:Uma2 family endonuclease
LIQAVRKQQEFYGQPLQRGILPPKVIGSDFMGAVLIQEYSFGYPPGDTTLDEYIEFCNLPQNQNKTFEMVDGYIIMMAGNTPFNHQRISGYIFRKIGNYLEGKKCEVFQEMKVHLFHEDIGQCKNTFQPDIMVVCDKDKAKNTAYEGAPEFIAEIVSKSTSRMDYAVKCDAHMNFGVKEYWIIDMFHNQIIVNINAFDGSYKIHSYTFEDVIKISVLENLSIDFSEVKKILT